MTWDNFFTAEVGAAAALAGLVFVGISINLQRIIALPVIANRAFQSLLLLLAILGVESILLVPGQTAPEQGVEVLVVAALTVGALNALEWRSWKIVDPKIRRLLAQHTLEIQAPTVLLVLGAAFLLVSSPWSLYWFLPATLVGFLIALVEAWVITVEILR